MPEMTAPPRDNSEESENPFPSVWIPSLEEVPLHIFTSGTDNKAVSFASLSMSAGRQAHGAHYMQQKNRQQRDPDVTRFLIGVQQQVDKRAERKAQAERGKRTSRHRALKINETIERDAVAKERLSLTVAKERLSREREKAKSKKRKAPPKAQPKAPPKAQPKAPPKAQPKARKPKKRKAPPKKDNPEETKAQPKPTPKKRKAPPKKDNPEETKAQPKPTPKAQKPKKRKAPPLPWPTKHQRSRYPKKKKPRIPLAPAPDPTPSALTPPPEEKTVRTKVRNPLTGRMVYEDGATWKRAKKEIEKQRREQAQLSAKRVGVRGSASGSRKQKGARHRALAYSSSSRSIQRRTRMNRRFTSAFNKMLGGKS